MLTLCKIAALGLAVASFVSCRPFPQPAILFPAAAGVVLAVMGGEPAREQLRATLPAALFALSFSLFTVVSSLAAGALNAGEAAGNAAAVVYVFLAARAGMRWIGRRGFGDLVRIVPSLRISLYAVLVFNALAAGARRNRLIRHQLMARFGSVRGHRWRLARYYAHNVILKELYTAHLNQAAIALRVNGPLPAAPFAPLTARDLAAALAAMSLAAAGFAAVTP